MRHEFRLHLSAVYGVNTCLDLVFETRYLLRGILRVDEYMVAGVDVRFERIVYIVEYDIIMSK